MNPTQQQQIMSRLLVNMVQGSNAGIANPHLVAAAAAAHQQAIAAAAISSPQADTLEPNDTAVNSNDLSPQSAFMNHIRQPLPVGSPISRIASNDGESPFSSMTGMNPFYTSFMPPPQGSPSSSAIFRMMQYQQQFGQQSPSNIMLPMIPPNFSSGSLAPGSDGSPTFGLFQGYLSPVHFPAAAPTVPPRVGPEGNASSSAAREGGIPN